MARRFRFEVSPSVQPLKWRPAADVYRTREGWLVKAELAGIRSEDIEIATSGRMLIIRGTRFDRETVADREFYTLEIAYSQFDRAIELPCELDCARLETSYRDGMLLVRVIAGESKP
jgi:HSP20 family protein